MVMLSPSPPVYEEVPPTLPPGYSLALYQVASDFSPQPDDVVDILAVDFISPGLISAESLASVIDNVAPLIARLGQEVEGYWLYRGPSIDVQIPATVEIFGRIYEVPFGGTTLFSADQYRLYVLLGNPGEYVAMGLARGQITPVPPGPWTVLAAGLVMVALLMVSAGVVMAWQGKIPWRDIVGPLRDLMPGAQAGEAIAAFSWPMFALGFAIVAFSTLGPSLRDIGAQVGFQRAGFGASAGVGRAPGLPAAGR